MTTTATLTITAKMAMKANNGHISYNSHNSNKWLQHSFTTTTIITAAIIITTAIKTTIVIIAMITTTK